MKWPAQSPDLNPIEQVWNQLDMDIRPVSRTSSTNVWNALQNAWNEYDGAKLDTYIKSMRKRCRAVIAAGGGHTKY